MCLVNSKLRPIFLLVVFLMISSLVFISCGGGGDSGEDGDENDGDGSVTQLEGEYIAIQMMDDEMNGGGYFLVNRMLLTFDSNGTGDFSSLSSSVDDAGTGSFTYTIGASNSITVTNNGGSDGGILSNDGKYFILQKCDSTSDDIFMMVGIKKTTNMSVSDLNGNYRAANFGENDISGAVSTTYYSANFLGTGSATAQILADSDSATGSTSFTYALSADGAYSDDGPNNGIALDDGALVIAADTETTSDSDVNFRIIIEQGSELSNATLNGTYIVAYFGRDHIGEASEESMTQTWELVFDGSGNGTATMMDHSQDVHQDNIGESFDFTYTVSGDGTLAIQDAWTENGIVKADGNSFVLLDTDSSDNELSIGFGIKIFE